MTAIVKDSIVSEVLQALNRGDLGKLTEAERGAYTGAVCKSLGLNPLTSPFKFLTLQGRVVMYATKDATEQLGKLHRISYEIVSRVTTDGIHQVVARASTPDGRFTESVGAVTVEGLKKDDLANAFMKAETKAKRRATLSVCGLSFMDETEKETVRGAKDMSSAPQLTTGDYEVPYATEIAACKTKDELQALYRERQADVAPEGKQAFLTAMADRKAELGK